MLSKKRQIRRKSFADKEALEVADPFDEELIEDIQSSAPNLKSLLIDVLDGNQFDSKGIDRIEKLESLQIFDGRDLDKVVLSDTGNLAALEHILIGISNEGIETDIDLRGLQGSKSIKQLNIECAVNSLNLNGLSSCSSLESISIIGMEGNPIDLSQLSACQSLCSIQIMNFGRDTSEDSGVYRIILPQNIPLDFINISAFNGECELDIDFSILDSRPYISGLNLINLSLTSFDFSLLSNVERIGQIVLLENEIEELDITPILSKTMNVYHGEPIALDDKTTVIIKESRERVEELIQLPNEKVTVPSSHGPIEYEFSFNWLQHVLNNYNVEWR